jgi:hypothetical protein
MKKHYIKLEENPRENTTNYNDDLYKMKNFK